MKISPIMYMGCKKDLIKKGLLNYFPNNIKTFYEPFGGSAIVSMNVNAEKYELSDINYHLIELYDLFKTKSSEEIIHYGHKIIEEYKLFSKSIDNRELDKYKDSFNKYRDYYNKYKNPMDLFVLSLFSFSQSIRFNNDDLYDNTIGNRSFSKNTEKNIFDGCKFFSQDNVNFYKRSFTDIDINVLNENDFIYFDPPYAQTNSPYNKIWTEENDNQLFNICEKLNNKNIKWVFPMYFKIVEMLMNIL